MKRFAWVAVGAVVAGCSAAPGSPEPTASTEEAVQQCETQVVEGVDVYDGSGTIDWTKVKAAGVDFAIMKATQGTYNTQKTFPANWSGAKAAGVYRSAYHFFDPTEDGAAQAQHFLSVVGTIGPGDLPPMLDVECPDGDPNCLGTGAAGTAAASDIRTRMLAWLTAVEQATGKKPIIYTFGSYFSSNGVDTTGLDAYPLYIADIVSGTCFNVPAPWKSAVIWQYSWTGTVSGIPVQVDRDRFIGTLAQLGAFAGETTGGGDAGGGPDSGKTGDGGATVDSGSGGSSGGDGGSGVHPDGGALADSGAGADASRGENAAAGAPGGCGCQAAGSGTPGMRWLAALAAALVVASRRRQSAGRMLPPRGREPTCRRPTSARA